MALGKKARAEVSVTAKNETHKGLKSVENSIRGLTGKVKGMFAGIGAGIAALGLGRLFTAAVQEAQDAAREMANIGTALRNVGVDAAKVRPEVDALLDSLTEKTGLDGGGIADSFQMLITQTRSYQAAIAGLPLALDLVAARQISFRQASDIVARALKGDEAALKAVGVTVGENQTAFEALSAAYGGFAEEAGKTLVGTLGRIREQWKKVLEQLGNALLGTESATEAGDKMVAMLVRLADWIEINASKIQVWVRHALKFVEVTGVIISTAGRLYDWIFKQTEQFGYEVMMIPEMVKIAFGNMLTHIADNLGELNDVLNKLGIHIGDGVVEKLKAAGERIANSAQVAKNMLQLSIDRLWEKADAPTPSAKVEVPKGDSTLPNSGDELAKGWERVDAKLAEADAVAKLAKNTFDLQTITEKFPVEPIQLPTPTEEQIGRAEEYGWAVSDAFGSAFDAVLEGENVFEAIAQATIGGIAKSAKFKAMEEVAESVKALALGLMTRDPKAFASAKMHAVAAVKFAAIAGAAGAAASAAGGGGAGGVGNRGGASRNGLSRSEELQGEATIVVKGNWRPNDPKFLDDLAKSLNAAKGRRLNIRTEP